MKKILAVISLVVFMTACGAAGSEKERFVSASTEIACDIVKDQTLYSDMNKILALSKDVFAKYGFDIEDDAAMQALSEKYQADDEVIQAVQAGAMKCLPAVK